jgi:hypothetical protein
MIRRRRRTREIPFSFDSFLDVVANVVGIIIRLILVVWVGARSYSSLSIIGTKPTQPNEREKLHSAVPDDPLQAELALRRRELDRAQMELLEQLRRVEEIQSWETNAQKQFAQLAGRREGIKEERAALDHEATAKEGASRRLSFSLAEVRERQQKLVDEIHALQQLPPAGHLLRYRTPVSRPLHADEFFFECHGGRVTFIDAPALLAIAQRDLDEKGQLLRTRWQVSDVTSSVGGFRLRYTVAREPGLSDAAGPAGDPGSHEGYRYGLAEWIAEPTAPIRGETLQAALADRSQFRQVVDRLDSEQAAITFWVYPDSFPLYRQLRDYLYDRNLVVAGRPLPEGVPITCSRQGSRSLGQ